MGNSYFNFKQFTVHQERCAMKVCTDACLFAAWVGDVIGKESIPPKRILDIGTGTGLLSLMLAQQVDANIDAIEIDGQAFQQAEENFAASPWSQRLTAFHSDAKQYTTNTRYDLIITNPPFFENDLKSDNSAKNLAKHDTGLTLDDILFLSEHLLLPTGKLALLLPSSRLQDMQQLAAAHQYSIHHLCNVSQTPRHGCFRSMLILGREPAETSYSEMTIREKHNSYTDEFIRLLSPYYLSL